ncbi:DMT family transporter [Kiloniella sp. EL199]|uniref:DMT family transporter n=1 Tax=Kiloniella sp. EL199 TaxID=2107581 RepID=UPI000EA0F200|nr:EamA family transporter [Kiloniella sp. EL199]
MRAPTLWDFILLTSLAAIWGSAFLAIKITVEDIPPATIAAGRLLIASIVIYIYMRSRSLNLPRDKSFWRQMILISFFSMAAPFAMISWAEQFISSGLTAILMATGPLIALILSHFFSTDDRFTLFKLLGVLVGFSGVVVVLGLETFSSIGDNFYAQIITMLAAMCYACSGILVRQVKEKSNTVITASILISATILILPVSLILETPWTAIVTSEANSILALLYLGLIPTALAFILRFYLIREVGVTFASYVGYLVPFFGVLWGALFLSERLPSTTMIGLFLILSGIAVSRIKLRKSASSS